MLVSRAWLSRSAATSSSSTIRSNTSSASFLSTTTVFAAKRATVGVRAMTGTRAPLSGARRSLSVSAAAREADQSLRRTALYDFHKAHGGRLVDFGGWELPVQYKNLGIIDSVLHTRSNASLFDVSHMCQVIITGKDRVAFAERVLVADVETMPLNTGSYTLMLNDKGCIIDDCLISNHGDSLYLVINAGTAEKDLAHMRKQMETFDGEVHLEELRSSHALVALQGPKAQAALARLIPDGEKVLDELYFFHGTKSTVLDGKPCIITRCGYTGEDGFEISVERTAAEPLAAALVEQPEVELAGLGARDALRLEASLCLYGHDIDETISPIEAALPWCISKRRREQGGFIGYDVVKEQLAVRKATKKRRVGLVVDGPPAREGATILSPEGEEVGVVTSGAHSPVLKKSISMGYVRKKFMKRDTPLKVQVRKKQYDAVVTKMPFVPTQYKMP